MHSERRQKPVPGLRKKEEAKHGFGESWDTRPEASAVRHSHKAGKLPLHPKTSASYTFCIFAVSGGCITPLSISLPLSRPK